jgi:hypothetical protein
MKRKTGVDNFRKPEPRPGMDNFRDPTETTRAYWRPVVDAATAEPTTNAVSMSSPPIRPGVDLAAAKGYEYEYKEPDAPGAAPGKQVGPMAQDLEHTAAKGTVHTGPDGKKSVDTGRLALVNTAALSEQQRRLERLEAIARIPMHDKTAQLPPERLSDKEEAEVLAFQKKMGWGPYSKDKDVAAHFPVPNTAALDAANAVATADTGPRTRQPVYVMPKDTVTAPRPSSEQTAFYNHMATQNMPVAQATPEQTAFRKWLMQQGG